jgi:hypothetical protein
MVDVIVTVRDAVFTALMTWGGIGDDAEAVATRSLKAVPMVAPAAIEETSGRNLSRPACANV